MKNVPIQGLLSYGESRAQPASHQSEVLLGMEIKPCMLLYIIIMKLWGVGIEESCCCILGSIFVITCNKVNILNG